MISKGNHITNRKISHMNRKNPKNSKVALPYSNASEDADKMANSVDPDQTTPLGAVWSGSALFAQTCVSQNLGTLRKFKWAATVVRGDKVFRYQHVNPPSHGGCNAQMCNTWETSWENLSLEIQDQVRLKLACSTTGAG